jgi:hypothetical protein
MKHSRLVYPAQVIDLYGIKIHTKIGVAMAYGFANICIPPTTQEYRHENHQ